MLQLSKGNFGLFEFTSPFLVDYFPLILCCIHTFLKINVKTHVQHYKVKSETCFTRMKPRCHLRVKPQASRTRRRDEAFIIVKRSLVENTILYFCCCRPHDPRTATLKMFNPFSSGLFKLTLSALGVKFLRTIPSSERERKFRLDLMTS